MDIEKVDPELRAGARRMTLPDVSQPLVRRGIRLALSLVPTRHFAGVDMHVEEFHGVRLRVYVPEVRHGDAALLWIHGGGLLFGDAVQDEELCAETARELGILVVSENYRLAPEHPFPAALADVHSAWEWLQVRARTWGVDRTRIVIGGESAGGGLAVSLVQFLHDESEVQAIGQWLFAPMIDDRTAADTSLDAVEHWIWHNRANRVGWSAYLGEVGRPDVPPYAAAARRTDLSGLPPAFIAVGDIELFHDEDEDYARRLGEAGVPVEFDLVPGAPHGFESWARGSTPARELVGRARTWLGELVR